MDPESNRNRIRLILLDGHGLFRATLSHFLASQPGIEVAGECANSSEALTILSRSDVDVVLLDLDLGFENEFITAAREAGYRGRFLLVIGPANVRSAAVALKLGASGIFLKTGEPGQLVHTIRLVSRGETWIDPNVIQMLASQVVDRAQQFHYKWNGSLEDRERNVLLGILGGLTNKKIGTNMGLSESAVKSVVQRLFGKAGVKTRTQLVRVALEGSLWNTQDWSSRNVERAEP